ncbi:hypothetical protein U1Q18_016719 [Sarracenia purpurea var. burkii]
MSGFAQSSCWGLGAIFGTVPAEGWLFLLLEAVPHQHRIITEGCGFLLGGVGSRRVSLFSWCSRFDWFGLLLVACPVSWPHGSCWVRLAASSTWMANNSAAMLKGGMAFHGLSEWSYG